VDLGEPGGHLLERIDVPINYESIGKMTHDLCSAWFGCLDFVLICRVTGGCIPGVLLFGTR